MTSKLYSYICSARIDGRVYCAMLVCSVLCYDTTVMAQSARENTLGQAVQIFDQPQVIRFASTAPKRSERSLAEGVLLSWAGNAEGASRWLTSTVDDRELENNLETEEALYYLSLDESLAGHYAKAYRYGHKLLRHQNFLHGNDLDDFSSQLAVWHALRKQPEQIAGLRGTVRLAGIPNASGRPEAYINLGNASASALFDTGAELTVVSRSLLEKLGVKPLPGHTRDVASSGAVSLVSMAVLPDLRMGTIALHNVPVQIQEDSALQLGSGKERSPIDMIVGYSVLRSLGTFGVDSSGGVVLNAARADLTHRASLLEVGPTLVMAAKIDGSVFHVLLDTGATSSVLTKSFFDQDRTRFRSDALSSEAVSGVGGSATVRRYKLDSVRLELNKGEVSLSNVSVYPQDSALDVGGLVGNMGRDLWGRGNAFQIDFHTHMLSF